VFPVSIGFSSAWANLFSYGVYVNPSDDNILVVGKMASDPAVPQVFLDDVADGIAARLSETNVIEWFVSFGYMKVENEAAMAVTLIQDHVYVGLCSENASLMSRRHAIVKLTYAEGKMQWSKELKPYNNIVSSTMVLINIRHFSVVPGSTDRFMMAHQNYMHSYTN
jgi:hypothetical protein